MPAAVDPIHVCIVGPDGSGKTTVADRLAERLTADGWSVVPVDARPAVVDRVTNRDHDYRDPHRDPPRSMARSTAKVAGKFAYAWAREARDRLRSRGHDGPTVLLEERGWLDHGVDNRRYRIHPRAAALVVRLGRLVPRPDLTVVLSGDPDEIASRKAELSAAEVARQQAEWHRLVDSTIGPNVELSTTAMSPEQTVDAICTVLPAP